MHNPPDAPLRHEVPTTPTDRLAKLRRMFAHNPRLVRGYERAELAEANARALVTVLAIVGEG